MRSDYRFRKRTGFQPCGGSRHYIGSIRRIRITERKVIRSELVEHAHHNTVQTGFKACGNPGTGEKSDITAPFGNQVIGKSLPSLKIIVGNEIQRVACFRIGTDQDNGTVQFLAEDRPPA